MSAQKPKEHSEHEACLKCRGPVGQGLGARSLAHFSQWAPGSSPSPLQLLHLQRDGNPPFPHCFFITTLHSYVRL